MRNFQLFLEMRSMKKLMGSFVYDGMKSFQAICKYDGVHALTRPSGLPNLLICNFQIGS